MTGKDRLWWLLDEMIVDPVDLVEMLGKWMSDADVEDCLDANELSERFDEDD
jgi:hypothetical protein